MTHFKNIVAAGLFCLSFNAAAQKPDDAPKDTLRFYNLHTKESLTVIRAEGDTVTKKTNWFMRDFRQKKSAKIDPELLDLLGDIKTEINRRYPKLRVRFHVISAYRAPETNEMLRKNGGAQAEQSLHTKSQAIDIRVPGLKTATLRDIATCIKRGGVGYYAAAEGDFVHVDIGRVRYWPSNAYVQKLKCK